MRRVLLIAATTGYQTRAFDDSARRLGVELTLATDRCHVLEDPWGDRALAVRFEDPQLSAARIAGSARERKIDGILAVDDRQAILAASAAAALEIPYNPVAATAACHDKHRARELYRAAGLPVPSFFRVALEDDPEATAQRARYPCVLKPLALSASRGVIRANDPAEFLAAFRRIRGLLERPAVRAMREEQNRYLQVEDYIPGREFALEGLLTRGRLQVLAIFDKPDPLEGPYFAETIYSTPTRAEAEVEAALVEMTERGIAALGLTHGPIHAELRYSPAGAWLLEIAARPIGGLCARALRFGGGRGEKCGLEELLLRHALGEEVSGWRRESSAAGVMMIPAPRAGIYRGAAGIERARAVRAIEDVVITAKEGQPVEPLPEGATYLGFIFSSAKTPAEVEAALREAHAALEFDIAPSLPALRP